MRETRPWGSSGIGGPVERGVGPVDGPAGGRGTEGLGELDWLQHLAFLRMVDVTSDRVCAQSNCGFCQPSKVFSKANTIWYHFHGESKIWLR